MKGIGCFSFHTAAIYKEARPIDFQSHWFNTLWLRHSTKKGTLDPTPKMFTPRFLIYCYLAESHPFLFSHSYSLELELPRQGRGAQKDYLV